MKVRLDLLSGVGKSQELTSFLTAMMGREMSDKLGMVLFLKRDILCI